MKWALWSFVAVILAIVGYGFVWWVRVDRKIRSLLSAQPVAPGTKQCFEVDLVYTWVNSVSDPQWTDVKNTYLGEPNEVRLPSQGNPELELHTSLQLALKHLPFVRHIYIVTMRPQTPSFLHAHPKIRLVHHDEIVPAEYLPTFNSNTIERYLHRIPDLSEHFVYLNDDVYVLKPCTQDHFFTSDGRPIHRIHYLRTLGSTLLGALPSLFAPSFEQSLQLTYKGFPLVLETNHGPWICTKRILQMYEDVCRDIQPNRFRSPQDFSLMHYSVYRAILEQHAVGLQDDETLFSYDVPSQPVEKHIRFLCINQANLAANQRAFVDFFQCHL